MSDKSEQMRPIPDGGLKEAMPSWLKRPPAWRELPTVEERHERTLPEPDTSTIDPHSLVDVNDLPQWLQSIAARGDVPAPAADPIAVLMERTSDALMATSAGDVADESVNMTEAAPETESQAPIIESISAVAESKSEPDQQNTSDLTASTAGRLVWYLVLMVAIVFAITFMYFSLVQ